jgi:hypothetical protein
MTVSTSVLVALDPFGLAAAAVGWDVATTRRFLAVWGVQIGAYAGPILGLTWGFVHRNDNRW